MDALATIIATITSSAVAALVAYLTVRWGLKIEDYSVIQDNLTKLIEISIQYPYLEDDNYCAKWTGSSVQSEEDLRYDNYCCLVFNLMSKAFKYYNYNDEKTNMFLYTPELINRHKKWWLRTKDNKKAYSEEFQYFVSRMM